MAAANTRSDHPRELKQFVERLVAAWNTHDIDYALTFYADNYAGRDVAQTGIQLGHEGMRNTLQGYFAAFPDLQFKVEGTICEGDRASLFWIAQGTHGGPVLHIPPTGRPIVVRGATLLQIDDAKVQRADYIWDLAGLLRCIGLLPDL